MISLNNVSRWYGQVIGLNDVTCEIGPGVTALLGMNGAGKSTMMRLITGQLRPTTGEITVNGLKPFSNQELYKILGYCPESTGSPSKTRVGSLLLYGAPRRDFHRKRPTGRLQLVWHSLA